MLVNSVTHLNFTPVDPSDTVGQVLERMNGLNVNVLPVVEHRTGKVIGQLVRQQLEEHEEGSDPISVLELKQPLVLYSGQHIFEAARMLLVHDVTILPVVDAQMCWNGIVDEQEIQNALTRLLNISAEGSVITLQVESQDYTLSEMVYLIESEGAHILSVAIEAPAEPGEYYHISFKLDVRDTSGVSHSLRRHGYTITTESQSEMLQFDMSDRADELMRYLDV